MRYGTNIERTSLLVCRCGLYWLPGNRTVKSLKQIGITLDSLSENVSVTVLFKRYSN